MPDLIEQGAVAGLAVDARPLGLEPLPDSELHPLAPLARQEWALYYQMPREADDPLRPARDEVEGDVEDAERRAREQRGESAGRKMVNWLRERVTAENIPELLAILQNPKVALSMTHRVLLEELGRTVAAKDVAGMRRTLADLVDKLDVSSPKDSAVLMAGQIGSRQSIDVQSLLEGGKRTVDGTQGAILLGQLAPILQKHAPVDMSGDLKSSLTRLTDRFALQARGRADLLLGGGALGGAPLSQALQGVTTGLAGRVPGLDGILGMPPADTPAATAGAPGVAGEVLTGPPSARPPAPAGAVAGGPPAEAAAPPDFVIQGASVEAPPGSPGAAPPAAPGVSIQGAAPAAPAGAGLTPGISIEGAAVTIPGDPAGGVPAGVAVQGAGGPLPQGGAPPPPGVTIEGAEMRLPPAGGEAAVPKDVSVSGTVAGGGEPVVLPAGVHVEGADVRVPPPPDAAGAPPEGVSISGVVSPPGDPATPAGGVHVAGAEVRIAGDAAGSPPGVTLQGASPGGVPEAGPPPQVSGVHLTGAEMHVAGSDGALPEAVSVHGAATGTSDGATGAAAAYRMQGAEVVPPGGGAGEVMPADVALRGAEVTGPGAPPGSRVPAAQVAGAEVVSRAMPAAPAQVTQAVEQALQLPASPGMNVGQLLRANPNLEQITLHELVAPPGGGQARLRLIGSIARSFLAQKLGAG